jgi:phage terminase small subunit
MIKRHPHPFVIADSDAVRALSAKVEAWGQHQQRREKLLQAFKEAAEAYGNAPNKDRQAFFHGLLTGYAVALKLW